MKATHEVLQSAVQLADEIIESCKQHFAQNGGLSPVLLNQLKAAVDIAVDVRKTEIASPEAPQTLPLDGISNEDLLKALRHEK